MRWRRAARRGVLSVVLGVVTTYLVAWVLFNTSAVPTQDPFTTILIDVVRRARSDFVPNPRNNEWDLWWESRVGSECIISAHAAFDKDTTARVRLRTGQASPIPEWAVASRWLPADLEARQVLGPGGKSYIVQRVAGWPMLAVVDGVVGSSGKALPGEGMSLRRRRSGGGWQETVIAFTPIWRGFAADGLLEAQFTLSPRIYQSRDSTLETILPTYWVSVPVS